MKNTPIIVEEMEKVLKEVNNERYYSKEEKDGRVIKEVLNKGIVIEDLNRYEEGLIKGILKNDIIKKHFTKNVAGSTIVLIDRLIDLLEVNLYFKDSFTNYKNKIGLAVDRNFIRETNDVVLDFPYKDTILKAGMTREDVEKFDDVDEDFYHELINAEERDRLFDEKIFVNSKKHDSNGVNYIDSFSDNDNLIIKGNNLIALHSIKERYRGQVKCIYIDPPYNTENDSFEYNDKFNRSTWLTFMKNRLEIAWDLLKDDGVIFVQCDDNEQAYLKVLMDEIFGEENFVNNIAVKMSEPSGNKMSHVDKRFLKIKEYILLYKMPSAKKFNPIKIPKDSWDEEYNKFLKNFSREDKKTIDDIAYKSTLDEVITEEDINVVDSILSRVESISINEAYKLFNEHNIVFDEWLKANSYRIYRTAASTSVKKLADQKRSYHNSCYFSVKSSRDGLLYLVKGDYSKTSKSPRLQILFAEDYLDVYVGDFWSDIATTGLEAEGELEFKNGKKPEKILERVISFSTEERDLVLDFFMGSGTTAAVAHKMNRRYIGIEQMDYIEDKAVERLKKVIEGEKSGISKDVNWQGAGSFVYVELMEKSRGYIKDLQKADSYSSLKEIYERMLDNVDINFKVDLEKVKEIINEAKISVEDMKEILIQIIDKNQLYYNYSEIEDENVRDLISDSDYKFNKSFYEGDING